LLGASHGADRERIGDLAWISKNFHIFMPAALVAYAELGRGALVVDTSVTVEGQGITAQQG